MDLGGIKLTCLRIVTVQAVLMGCFDYEGCSLGVSRPDEGHVKDLNLECRTLCWAHTGPTGIVPDWQGVSHGQRFFL